MPGPGTWVAGDILTAADLNAIGTWTTYTPTLRGNLATVGCTVNYAEYCLINKLVSVNVRVTSTGTASGNGPIEVSLPLNPTPTSNQIFGSGYFYDSSATDLMLVVASPDSGNLRFATEATGSFTNPLGTTPAITLGINDVVSFSVTYRVA